MPPEEATELAALEIAIADKVTGTGVVESGHAIPAQLDLSLEEEVCRTVRLPGRGRSQERPVAH